MGAPDYLQHHGVPGEPSDLLRHQCLRQRFPSGTIFAWTFEKAGRAITIVPEGRLILSDARHLVRASAAGLGLSRVRGDWCPHIPSWFLYYPSRRQSPPAMRAFLDFITRRRSEESWA